MIRKETLPFVARGLALCPGEGDAPTQWVTCTVIFQEVLNAMQYYTFHNRAR